MKIQKLTFPNTLNARLWPTAEAPSLFHTCVIRPDYDPNRELINASHNTTHAVSHAYEKEIASERKMLNMIRTDPEYVTHKYQKPS